MVAKGNTQFIPSLQRGEGSGLAHKLGGRAFQQGERHECKQEGSNPGHVLEPPAEVQEAWRSPAGSRGRVSQLRPLSDTGASFLGIPHKEGPECQIGKGRLKLQEAGRSPRRHRGGEEARNRRLSGGQRARPSPLTSP